MKNCISFTLGLLCITMSIKAQTVTDVDGNVYETITIGDQCWMKQNLKTTHYRDGSPITYIEDNNEWGTDSVGGYCFYNNSIDSANEYGALYNWYAASNAKNLAPQGWHIPSDEEWEKLVEYLGSGTGGQMKETGTEHWKSPNTSATNSSQFTALGAGFRGINGVYYQMHLYCSWWSTSIYSENSGWSHELYYISPGILRVFSDKNYGFSIRCIKDSETGIGTTESKTDFKIFPNPANDKITLSHTEDHIKESTVIITTLDGREVLKKIIHDPSSSDIDISFINQGIYIIKIMNQDLITSQKLIIQ